MSTTIAVFVMVMTMTFAKSVHRQVLAVMMRGIGC